MTIRKYVAGYIYLAGYKLAGFISPDAGMALIKHRARKRYGNG